QRCAGVLVIGIAGLRWDDVGPDTPALARLAATGAVGVLSVKALPALTCPADGWLTLGAGARAQAYGAEREPCGGSLDLQPTDAARNERSRDGASLGALDTALDGGLEVSGPGAELAAVRSGPGPADQPVVVVDGGTLRAVDRSAALRTADAVVAQAVAARPAAVDLLVVGLSEAAGSDEPRLHVAIATGPSFPRGALTSSSTRRPPYVQLIDVAPTVLDRLALPVPEVMDGQPWRVSGAAPSVAELVDLDRKARAQLATTVPFIVVFFSAAVGLFALACWRRRARLAEIVALTATGALGASYLANLLPWWRADSPLLALLAVVVPLALAVALLAAKAPMIFARWGSTRRAAPRDGEDHREERQVGAPAVPGPAAPAALVCGFVAAALLGDLLTGAGLQISSVAGYSPLVAGRFAGIGNVAFGVLAASVLLATAVLARRASAIAAVAVVAVAVDGAPPWGSDVGGVLALVPAFFLLAMLRTGRRVSIARLAAATLAGAAVVAVFALADWTRPAGQRTHLGRFVQDVADGTAGEVLQRKAAAVFELLFLSPVTALLPLLVAAVVYLVARPPAPLRRAFDASPAWRQGLLALGLACLLGFGLNDSGAAIPALALCVGIPATAAVAVRARRRPGASRPARTAVPVA
ncbi:MAG: alkaline phosphatase family protein, partial [Actinomycetota bacterium]|nr:alkaline phosphatase family protein [Actinomycetota bacterium]